MNVGYVIAADRTKVTVQTNGGHLSLFYLTTYTPRIGDIVSFHPSTGVVHGLADSGGVT